jgi:L-seryl-tRNA(Ser) seleniumtransferase
MRASATTGASGRGDAYAMLPSVDAVAGAMDGARWSHEAMVRAARDAIDALRARIRDGDVPAAQDCSETAVARAAAQRLEEISAPRLRRVVNATGIVLHTNLGRARLADEAVEAMRLAASGACNLEYDVARGARGDRDSLVEEHLCALTGAEAATVVNNNAAGVVLALHSLARGREVVVSRGELIEIGGSLRIPDVMEASGAVLREVGTTNRTHPADYRRAIGPNTALLMKIHTSNYRIVGFTSAVELAELAALAREHDGVAVVEDLGAGAIVDLREYGLAGEPVVAERLAAGADLVLASGDKLLGGPQCGIVVGRAALVERLRRNPLRRALRCDKTTLAALEATLRLYRFAPDVARAIPTLRYLRRPAEELERVGAEALPLLRAALGDGWQVELVVSTGEAGSGSWPGVRIESRAIAVRASGLGAAQIERRFRLSDPAIVGRIAGDTFLLDLRLIDDAQDLVPGGAAPKGSPRVEPL